MNTKETGLAIIGTGYVADYYMKTFSNYPDLTVLGAWDRDPERLARFGDHFSVPTFSGMAEVFADPNIEIVVNLTSAESHYNVSRAALVAGKHVYSEKPVALSLSEVADLVTLADIHDVTLCAAPASILSESFRGLKEVLETGQIGDVKLIMAEMDDGMIHTSNWREWRNSYGVRWPGEAEFELGSTLEHASYPLSWLVGLFGPAVRMKTFSKLVFASKLGRGGPPSGGTDFSVGCVEFSNGAVARLTCCLGPRRDRSLTIVGEKGTVWVRDIWDARSTIRIAKHGSKGLIEKISDKFDVLLRGRWPFCYTPGKAISFARNGKSRVMPAYPSCMDFAAGVAAQAHALRLGIAPPLSGEYLLHLSEIVLALEHGEDWPKRESAEEAEPMVLRKKWVA